jgi:uncharacterized membrane protein YGL010W
MRKIDTFFNEYAQSHQNQTNKNIHWVCVPLIFWSILGFISLIPSAGFTFPKIGFVSYITLMGIVLISLFYARLSLKIAGYMLVVLAIFVVTNAAVNTYLYNDALYVYAIVFVVSWVFQFIGHKIEGKKPSFLKDLQFLLIGPIWLLHFLLKKMKINY